MKKIGLVYHPLNQRALEQAHKAAAVVAASSAAHWVCSAWEPGEIRAHLDGTDMVITAGGDGTILRVAQVLAGRHIPIFGINLGRLGFMTEISTTEMDTVLPEVLNGAGWLDERTMLQACLHQGGAHQEEHRFIALNDVVFARGEIARIVYVTAFIDGEELTTFKSDGAVVATATGSTGYALAAGGPVMNPRAAGYILAPLMPHLSLRYPLVLAPESVTRLLLHTTHQATLSIDGHISLPLTDGASVEVSPAAVKTYFWRVHPPGYFYSALERKLKG